MKYSDYLDGANDNSPTKKRRYPQPIGNQSGSLGDALKSGNFKTGPITRKPGRPNGSMAGDLAAKSDQMKKDAIRRRLGNIAKR